MPIADADIKRLWGLAAGICSRPGCNTDCIPFLGARDPTVVGEMAHVIARKPSGPRGIPGGGEDSYDNLILLCPTCHTIVDKAPEGTFPESTLNEWKREHETAVRTRLAAPVVRTRQELGGSVLRLLIENHSTWNEYGPESDAAKSNPISSVAEFWAIRKVAQIVPNNTRIVRLLETNAHLLTTAEYETARRFVEHAAGFQASCLDRLENVPRFPPEFEEMIRDVARAQ